MKLYLIIGAVVGLLASFAGTAWFAYDAGKDAERALQSVLIEEARSEERAKVKEVIKYREKIKVKYRDRIKHIKVAQDPTGCADTRLTDMGFGLHQNSQD